MHCCRSHNEQVPNSVVDWLVLAQYEEDDADYVEPKTQAGEHDGLSGQLCHHLGQNEQDAGTHSDEDNELDEGSGGSI